MVEASDPPGGSIRVEPGRAAGFVARIFVACGVPPTDSNLIGEVLVGADMRGIRSHGLARLPYFLVRLQRGVISADSEMRYSPGSSTTGVLDAGNGIGIVAAKRAMEQAMEIGREHGAGVVAVRGSSHFGYAGFWAEMAMRAGFIGIAMSNSGGRVAPTFGTEGILGTNPLAVAIPGGAGGTDFLLDMATSTVAVGKVETGLREGRQPSPGWVVSPEQARLDDNGVLGFETALLPLGGAGTEFGGHKGYGLALMVELLCGALTGTSFADRVHGAGGDAPPAMGHLMAAIRVDGFRPPAEVAADMEATFSVIRRSAKAPGRDRIYVHGEPEAEAMESSRRHGIVVTPAVLGQLQRWAARLGVEPLSP